jgi:hypothetical protein
MPVSDKLGKLARKHSAETTENKYGEFQSG